MDGKKSGSVSFRRLRIRTDFTRFVSDFRTFISAVPKIISCTAAKYNSTCYNQVLKTCKDYKSAGPTRVHNPGKFLTLTPNKVNICEINESRAERTTI